MNLSPRAHGWDSVESKVIAWLKKTERSLQSTHLLETDYSVPQSCVVSLDEPKTEELGSTVYVQRPSNPWSFKGTSATTSRTTQYCGPEAGCDASNPSSKEYLSKVYSISDEVSTTSSDQSAGGISSPHLVKANSEAYLTEDHRPELRTKWIVDTSPIDYFNDSAWDNFSIVQALDLPL